MYIRTKGLEALERLYCSSRLDLSYVLDNKHKNDYSIIEKELKALEIIKKKAKDQLHYLAISRNYEEYLRYCDDNNIPLQVRYSLEEFDLLNEVLKDESSND